MRQTVKATPYLPSKPYPTMNSQFMRMTLNRVYIVGKLSSINPTQPWVPTYPDHLSYLWSLSYPPNTLPHLIISYLGELKLWLKQPTELGRNDPRPKRLGPKSPRPKLLKAEMAQSETTRFQKIIIDEKKSPKWSKKKKAKITEAVTKNQQRKLKTLPMHSYSIGRAQHDNQNVRKHEAEYTLPTAVLCSLV